jgi:hypothetical protein
VPYLLFFCSKKINKQTPLNPSPKRDSSLQFSVCDISPSPVLSWDMVMKIASEESEQIETGIKAK